MLQLLPKIQPFEHAEQLTVIQPLLKPMTSNFHVFLRHSQLWATQVSYQQRGLASHHHHHIVPIPQNMKDITEKPRKP